MLMQQFRHFRSFPLISSTQSVHTCKGQLVFSKVKYHKTEISSNNRIICNITALSVSFCSIVPKQPLGQCWYVTAVSDHLCYFANCRWHHPVNIIHKHSSPFMRININALIGLTVLSVSFVMQSGSQARHGLAFRGSWREKKICSSACLIAHIGPLVAFT